MASDLRSRLFIGLAVAGAKLKSCDHSWIRSWAGSLYAGAVVSARKNKLIELHVFPKMACTLNSIRSWYKWRFWVTFRRLNIKEQKIAHHFNRNDEIPHLYLSLWLPFNSTLAQKKPIFFFLVHGHVTTACRLGWLLAVLFVLFWPAQFFIHFGGLSSILRTRCSRLLAASC